MAIGPPAGALPAEVRQTICRLGVPLAPERPGDRLEHLSIYRQLRSPGQEELSKNFAIPCPVVGGCRFDLRPPGHLTGSSLGNETVKHARATCAVTRHQSLSRRPRASLTRSKTRNWARARRPEDEATDQSHDRQRQKRDVRQFRIVRCRPTGNRPCSGFSVATPPGGVAGPNMEIRMCV